MTPGAKTHGAVAGVLPAAIGHGWGEPPSGYSTE